MPGNAGDKATFQQLLVRPVVQLWGWSNMFGLLYIFEYKPRNLCLILDWKNKGSAYTQVAVFDL